MTRGSVNSRGPLATMDEMITVEIGRESGEELRHRGASASCNSNTLFEPEQVFHIMASLQEEQKRSTELMDTIRSEHKKSVSLRRLVAGLSTFVVLLCVANIGTSFVAARLAQDVRVSVTHDLTTTQGDRLGTTGKEIEIQMQPPPSSGSERHRHLQSASGLFCDQETECGLQGMLKLTDAVKMYQAFCPEWPNQSNTCKGEGVPHLNLNCNGVRSTIHGGMWVPPHGPALDTVSWSWMMFPNNVYAYTATETTFSSTAGRFQEPCVLHYQLTMACETNMNDCAVLASFDTDQCPGRFPNICGNPQDQQ